MKAEFTCRCRASLKVEVLHMPPPFDAAVLRFLRAQWRDAHDGDACAPEVWTEHG